MTLLSLMLWLVPIALVGGGAIYAYRQYEKVRPKHEVVVGIVQKMTAAEAEKLLSAKGYLQSRYQAMVGAMTPGRVERVMVEEGTPVKKGDVLAVLEHNELKATLESRLAWVQRMQAELMESEATLEDKQRRELRARTLYSKQAIDLNEFDEAVTARKTAAARVAALQAGIKLQAAQVKETQEQIRNMHVIAPFTGTVVTKEAEVGETITPGGMGAASGRGSVVTLADLDHMEVEADVSEGLLSRLAPDQPAEISVSAVPDKRFRGKLRQIIPYGDRSRGTVKVQVEIQDKDPRLFPELVATVHFLPMASRANQQSQAAEIFVPKEAIVEEAGHAHVWVVDGNGTVRKQGVEVVVTPDALARVEQGLKGGESVVLTPPPGIVDGQLVKVKE